MIARRWGRGRSRAAAKRRMARRWMGKKVAYYGDRLVVHVQSGTLGVLRRGRRLEPEVLRLVS